MNNLKYFLNQWTFTLLVPNPVTGVFNFGSFQGGNSVLNDKEIFGLQIHHPDQVSLSPDGATMVPDAFFKVGYVTLKYNGCAMAYKLPFTMLNVPQQLGWLYKLGVGTIQQDFTIICDRGRVLNFQDCEIQFGATTIGSGETLQTLTAGNALVFTAHYWDTFKPNGDK